MQSFQPTLASFLGSVLTLRSEVLSSNDSANSVASSTCKNAHTLRTVYWSKVNLFCSGVQHNAYYNRTGLLAPQTGFAQVLEDFFLRT